MMAARASFTGFDPYKLTGVGVTDRELGHGSYATVLELEYMGLKCAGKKIHELLLKQGNASYTVRRFEEECRLLSQVRHPNIVQFLGVYFQKGVQAPILVMEFLHTNLTNCIEQYGILPKEISYSILHDVALGLCYLHSQTPPIIHRDLSSNNVLLTPNMIAKISDLGVARILNLTPLQVSHMTQTPGTPAYMPPEVMVAKPRYDTSVDEFSYGIMMIHIFSGKWPEPQVGQVHVQPGGRMIPVSEAERREVFLRAIGNDHPLMNLIRKCIDNYPQTRAHASEIVKQLAEMVLQFPISFANQLEMLQLIEALTQESKRKDGIIQQINSEISTCTKKIQVLTEKGEKMDRLIQQKETEILLYKDKIQTLTKEGERKDEIIEQKEHQISLSSNRLQAVEEQKTAEIDGLRITYFSEVEQLQLQLKDLDTQNQLMRSENEAEIIQLKSMVAVYETQQGNNAKSLLHERQQSEMYLTREREQNEIKLADTREQLMKEREMTRKLMVDNHNMQSSLLQLRSDIETLKTENAIKDSNILRKGSELEAKSRALEEKDVTISAMNKQLTKVRAYLTTNKQVLHARLNIVWRECAKRSTKVSNGNATVIHGKIFYGGVSSDNEADELEYTVYCYDPSQDKWTTLPPLPVRWFGLGQVNGKLVAVGGEKSADKQASNGVYTYYDKSIQKWRQEIPPMPTARHSTGVLSLQSALLVAGGGAPSYTDAVEIFKTDTSQWYRTNPLPIACRDMSELVVIGNTCYALGGYKGPSNLNQALYALVDDLLGNAVPANLTTHSGSNDTQSAWKTLPNTPIYRPAAAALAGKLLAIGGDESSEGGADMKEVYMYSPSTNSWIYISDLPIPLSNATAAVLSSTEILVIGGYNGCRVNSVYKGTLHLNQIIL